MKQLITIALLALLSAGTASAKKQKGQQYKVAVSDLMILKRQKLGAISRASEVGAEGVEVDMGGLGKRETFENALAYDSVRSQYTAELKKYNLEICSMAMTGFFSQSFAERETYQKMVADCIATMKQMNVKVAFLPLGVQGDLKLHPELRPAIVARLKVAGKMAEDAGVVIGIETALDATEEKKLIDDIDSKGIRIYFNFSNPWSAGRDVCEELKILGKKYICQIHCTNKDGVWLQNDPQVDMPKVKKTLDKMKWSGWLVLERSRDANDAKNVKKNFGANVMFVKSVFEAAQ